MTTQNLIIRTNAMHDISAAQWDALVDDDNPFLTHRFLSSLEHSQSIGAKTGWLPRHLTVHSPDQTQLLAAMPLYLRGDSYGEYIFDWQWARAAQGAGIAYYPKLTSAIPFTPATGARVLSSTYALSVVAAGAALAYGRQCQASSVHALYVPHSEKKLWHEVDCLWRTSMQFHFYNPLPAGASFEDWLQLLDHGARKNIKKERKRVAETGLRIDVVAGRDVPAELIGEIFALYTSTYDRKWGRPYLTRAFFDETRTTLGDMALYALAFDGDKLIAMSFSFVRGQHLYGRNWGCSVEVPGLHFEMCYYRLIDEVLARGLTRFEAGAQGEHKLKRGFLPTLTYSAHHIAHPGLRDAVSRAVDVEAAEMQEMCRDYAAHIPYRADAIPAAWTARSAEFAMADLTR